MCKEMWIQSFEAAVEDLAEEHDIEDEEAEELLKRILDKDPRYLDGYLTYEI